MLNRASIRSFSSTRAAALKVAARDTQDSLVSSLSVVVNSGSKTGKAGVAHLLSKFNFLNTEAKSALRFTREAELLGGAFSSTVTRDAIVLKTQFLKQDLPYFVEALGNVLTKTSFRPHELVEIVKPTAKAEFAAAAKDPLFLAMEELHALSFKKSYGQPLYYNGTSNVTLDDITAFAKQAYTSDNISVFGSGIVEEDLLNFTQQTAFADLKTGALNKTSIATTTGKESRIRSSGASTAIIGVPVAPADFAKFELLSVALGSAILPGTASPLSALPGQATSQLFKYGEAGLFVISVTDSSAETVSASIKAAKKHLTSVSNVSDYVKSAQLSAALQSTFESPVELNISGSTEAPKISAFNYVAVGDIDVLPYADEL